MPAAGAALGRSPRPAPDWLHQLPAWIRRSMRDSLTKVSTLVEVLALVGRFGPPQPLREVSISMPMFELKPTETSLVRNAWAKLSSSTYWFQSTHLDCRTLVPFTEVLMVKYASVRAEWFAVFVMKPVTLLTLPDATAVWYMMSAVGPKFESQPIQP